MEIALWAACANAEPQLHIKMFPDRTSCVSLCGHCLVSFLGNAEKSLAVFSTSCSRYLHTLMRSFLSLPLFGLISHSSLSQAFHICEMLQHFNNFMALSKSLQYVYVGSSTLGWASLVLSRGEGLLPLTFWQYFPISSACQYHSEWWYDPLVYELFLPVSYHKQTCWGYTLHFI